MHYPRDILYMLLLFIYFLYFFWIQFFLVHSISFADYLLFHHDGCSFINNNTLRDHRCAFYVFLLNKMQRILKLSILKLSFVLNKLRSAIWIILLPICSWFYINICTKMIHHKLTSLCWLLAYCNLLFYLGLKLTMWVSLYRQS